jgi:hypothetical protein
MLAGADGAAADHPSFTVRFGRAIRSQPLDLRLRQDRAQQLGGNVAFNSRSRFLEQVE